MERKAGGQEQFEAAKTLLRKAKTVEELKAAQTVVLPLKLNLTLEQTTVAIGRYPSRARTQHPQVATTPTARRVNHPSLAMAATTGWWTGVAGHL